MTNRVHHIPEGYHSVTPYIIAHNVAGLIDFIKQVFAATEKEIFHQPDGSVMHAELRIGDSLVMLAEASAEYGPFPAMLHIYVEDADAAYRRGLTAGATSIQEPADQFYGDRTAGFRDTFGNTWWLATHIEDVPPEEMQRRAEARERQQS
jgi:uncharacterized glyoxalase superfamily protein PhnB